MARRSPSEFWLALRSIDGLGDVLCVRLARRFGGAEAVFAAPRDALVEAGCRPDVAARIAAFRDFATAADEIERARDAGAEVVGYDDAAYPAGLRFSYDPPPVLYVRGRLETSDACAIAIVGSRHASPYGVAAADLLARDLVAAGVTVVSGLALGIDAAAHRGALSAGGRTVAVLGCGIDRAYPARHHTLAGEIAGGRGAVVSELPLGTPPHAANFPKRNRIVSALSLGVVVVEASDKSGSLITARLALEQGREVFAVPGEIGRDRTRGTHRLIRQGAKLVECGADVLEETFPWLLAKAAENRQTRAPGSARSPDAAKLLDCFGGMIASVETLIEESGLGAARVLELLLELELAGVVEQHPGMAYSKRRA